MKEETQKTSQNLTSQQVEELYRLWKKLESNSAVAEASKLHPTTISKYKKQGKWEERLAAELKEARELLDHAEKLKNIPSDQIREDTMRKIEIALNLRATRIQEAMANGENEDGITNELQKMAATLEKTQIVEIKHSTGGVEERNVNVNIQKVDYAALAKIYVEAKKDGVKFDDKGHLEKVMELAYNKDKKEDK